MPAQSGPEGTKDTGRKKEIDWKSFGLEDRSLADPTPLEPRYFSDTFGPEVTTFKTSFKVVGDFLLELAERIDNVDTNAEGFMSARQKKAHTSLDGLVGFSDALKKAGAYLVSGENSIRGELVISGDNLSEINAFVRVETGGITVDWKALGDGLKRIDDAITDPALAHLSRYLQHRVSENLRYDFLPEPVVGFAISATEYKNYEEKKQGGGSNIAATGQDG